ncbi:MAG: hypothetical protein ACTSYB_17710 [Candidatus Helarchaeota archaeon]
MGLQIIHCSPEWVKKAKWLLAKQKEFIVNIPITQELFDNLTLLAPTLWEVLILEGDIENFSELEENFSIIPIPPKLFEMYKKLRIEIMIQSNTDQISLYTLPAELAVITTIREITIPRIYIALGMLQNCNLILLKELTRKFYNSQDKIIKFLIELASIRIYRSDKVWDLLVKYNFEAELGRFSLYVRDFIKNEFIYEKVMQG